MSTDILAQARRQLEEKGKPKKALELLDKAPPEVARSPAGLALRGHVLLELGRDEEARDALEAAAAAEPPSCEALLELGWWDLDEGELEAAREQASRVLALSDTPGRAREEAHGLLIEALLDLGDRAGARAALAEHEREHGGDHPAVLLGRGRLLFLDGAFAEAVPALQAARKAAPAALAWWWEAVALERVGRLEEADRAYREAHRLDPATHVPVRIPDAEFDAVVEATLRTLPPQIRRELEETCTIVREEFPDPTRAGDDPDGPDPFLLGECLGTAERTRRGDAMGLYAGGDGWQDLAPTQIHLYRRNLERGSRDRDELDEEIRTTLLHEVGHALGLDEDGVADLGLA